MLGNSVFRPSNFDIAHEGPIGLDVPRFAHTGIFADAETYLCQSELDRLGRCTQRNFGNKCLVRASDVLLDGLGRVDEAVYGVLEGLDDDELAWRADNEANSIAWLIWHLTRVQDDHISEAAGAEQIWHSDGWYERFGLGLKPDDTGYGHDSREVSLVTASGDLLGAYYGAVSAASRLYVATLSEEDLDRIVDRRWGPPVTLGVRLVSVISDDLQHLGQAAFVRGMIERGSGSRARA